MRFASLSTETAASSMGYSTRLLGRRLQLQLTVCQLLCVMFSLVRGWKYHQNLPSRSVEKGKMQTQIQLGRITDVRLFSSITEEKDGEDSLKLLLYNTMMKEKREFKPMLRRKVKFYSCGPTVYDFAHVGNFRAFLTYDVLKRWLEYCGYDVDHVCNLTDIDDKIIKKMEETGLSLEEITNMYTKAFMDDLDVLNIKKAQRYPKATEHMTDIKEMIQTLIDKEFAYTDSKGSVYFRVSKFEDYGKLARLDVQGMQDKAGETGINERRGMDEKESARDFALWKARDDGDDSGVLYDMPWGKGRPGWHIECSAMANKLLGPSIDIHAGGVDLVFPHHENEIAQSEAYSGQTFCNCWVHNGFVNIDNEKMSKSLKNFKTLRDIAQKPNDAKAYRMMVVSAQYRSALSFTDETFKASVNSLKRIEKCVGKLHEVVSSEKKEVSADSACGFNVEDLVKTVKTGFENAMCDDLNTPMAFASFFKLIGDAEKAMKRGQMSASSAQLLLDQIYNMDKVFGLFYDVPTDYFGDGVVRSTESKGTVNPSDVPTNIIALIEERIQLKASKDYKAADEIRDQLKSSGYEIKDGKDGSYEIFNI